MAGKMISSSCRKLKYEELMKYTENFSENNFLGTFQFGKVYRGKIEQSAHEIQHVMVKIWQVPERYEYLDGDNEARLMYELMLLRHEKFISHPGMIKLSGYCWDGEHLGVVYSFKPLDIVHNLVPKDGFTWLQRIKVAVRFAHVVSFLHTRKSNHKPFVIRNISASHIVVDEEFNPKLYDFGMISGGIFPDGTVYDYYYLFGCYGYVDTSPGPWSTKDVFAFGNLLLYLITKNGKSYLDFLIDDWAHENYKCSERFDNKEGGMYSFVHPSLALDPEFSCSDGRKISKLAIKCIDREYEYRPSMKQVLKHLLKLQVVKKHADFLGLGAELQAGP